MRTWRGRVQRRRPSALAQDAHPRAADAHARIGVIGARASANPAETGAPNNGTAIEMARPTKRAAVDETQPTEGSRADEGIDSDDVAVVVRAASVPRQD